MNELLKLITGMVGDKVSITTLLKLAPVLAPVIQDLSDGDTHLSAENRLKIQELLESEL
ncbi:hypothetical protein [Deinococcus detaillensis]|uniref:hypothetical protein n=1 Tax=Deinococcus detaillensis TaxID=2592048 RepID=UPI00163D3E44|nr:hypothetical protein [Deinococcus detaillensis]